MINHDIMRMILIRCPFSLHIVWNELEKSRPLINYILRNKIHQGDEFGVSLYWGYLARYMSLSEEFIREFADLMYTLEILNYQELSEEFRAELA